MRELREDRICRQLRWRATSCSGKRVCSGGWGEEQMIEDAVEVGVCFLVCFGCSFHTSHIIIIGQSRSLPIASLSPHPTHSYISCHAISTYNVPTRLPAIHSRSGSSFLPLCTIATKRTCTNVTSSPPQPLNIYETSSPPHPSSSTTLYPARETRPPHLDLEPALAYPRIDSLKALDERSIEVEGFREECYRGCRVFR